MPIALRSAGPRAPLVLALRRAPGRPARVPHRPKSAADPDSFCHAGRPSQTPVRTARSPAATVCSARAAAGSSSRRGDCWPGCGARCVLRLRFRSGFDCRLAGPCHQRGRGRAAHRALPRLAPRRLVLLVVDQVRVYATRRERTRLMCLLFMQIVLDVERLRSLRRVAGVATVTRGLFCV